ncbi:MAG: cyclic nucleotide-binding domain-containing protein [Pseudanabaenaceae cyanobacterium bins.39]|nr:cyclic nucleotide-binding domain-containing protein [Pseudanabaenaceae cyanobacterium bins.39]
MEFPLTTIDIFQNSQEFVCIPAGQAIFRQGDPADVMYAIVEGEVDILIDGKLLDTTGKGGLVGEMAMIESVPRRATVIAKTDCKIVPISEHRFKFLVQQTPNFAINVMKIMVERIRKLNALVINH